MNGIDTEIWNPETDNCITQNFSIDHLNLRKINKEKILQDFDLEKNARKPLLVLISRLSHQKGINLILEGLPLLLNEGWVAIFLGSGQVELENGLKISNLKRQAASRQYLNLITIWLIACMPPEICY